MIKSKADSKLKAPPGPTAVPVKPPLVRRQTI